MKTYDELTDEVLEKVKKEKARRRGAAKTAVSFALVLVLMLGTVLVAGQVNRAPEKTAPGGTQNGRAPALKNEDPLSSGREYGEIYDLLEANGYDPRNGSGLAYSGDGEMFEGGIGAQREDSADVDSGEYSKTNVQVEGIDEADVVKTDGKYIYAVSNSNVYIFSAEDGGMETVAKVPLRNEDRSSVDFNGLYLYWGIVPVIYATDDRLIVISNMFEPSKDEQGNETSYWSFDSREYYSAAVYDITDRAAPALVGTASVSGYGLSSRMTDGKLFLIAKEEFHGEISRDDPATYIPTLYENGAKELVDTDSIYCGGDESNCTYLNVTEIDVSDASVTSTVSVLGYDGRVIYQSPDSIFVAKQIYEPDREEETKDDITVVTSRHKTETGIAKISVSGGLALAGSARIDGFLHNSFSMDEDEGYLRLVTSVTDSVIVDKWHEADENYERYLIASEDSGENYNDLYVLDPSMNVTGSIVGLAPDERIYSCRFEGNDGYFVTYRETDPLFHVDLSDPANPRVIDELKIPGHSDYLQRFGEYMLGFGQDDDGYLKLSMFSEDENGVMSEIAVTSFPGVMYSEALRDHHAILADADRGIICFSAEGWSEDVSSYCMLYYIITWDGQEFGVAVKSELGEACGTLRGFYIGDYFYLYTDCHSAADTLTSYSLADFGEIDRETMDEPDYDPDPYFSGYAIID